MRIVRITVILQRLGAFAEGSSEMLDPEGDFLGRGLSRIESPLGRVQRVVLNTPARYESESKKMRLFFCFLNKFPAATPSLRGPSTGLANGVGRRVVGGSPTGPFSFF
jgi:hypothetical protein